jgi:hypothetical protein
LIPLLFLHNLADLFWGLTAAKTARDPSQFAPGHRSISVSAARRDVFAPIELRCECVTSSADIAARAALTG